MKKFAQLFTDGYKNTAQGVFEDLDTKKRRSQQHEV
jgi:hypothetical protein